MSTLVVYCCVFFKRFFGREVLAVVVLWLDLWLANSKIIIMNIMLYCNHYFEKHIICNGIAEKVDTFMFDIIRVFLFYLHDAYIDIPAECRQATTTSSE